MESADRETLSAAADRLAGIVKRTEKPLDGDQLRGAEGEAGQVYFSVLDHLVRGERPLFAFKGRSRRPPMDATNALLSFAYALLTSDVRGALESVGLDPAVVLDDGPVAEALVDRPAHRAGLEDRDVAS